MLDETCFHKQNTFKCWSKIRKVESCLEMVVIYRNSMVDELLRNSPSPMQHLWQPFVSGILVVRAKRLRRKIVKTLRWAKVSGGQVKKKQEDDEGMFDISSSTTATVKVNQQGWTSHLGRILSGKRCVWNWAARPGFLSCSNSPIRLWEYSWKDLPTTHTQKKISTC